MSTNIAPVLYRPIIVDISGCGAVMAPNGVDEDVSPALKAIFQPSSVVISPDGTQTIKFAAGKDMENTVQIFTIKIAKDGTFVIEPADYAAKGIKEEPEGGKLGEDGMISISGDGFDMTYITGSTQMSINYTKDCITSADYVFVKNPESTDDPTLTSTPFVQERNSLTTISNTAITTHTGSNIDVSGTVSSSDTQRGNGTPAVVTTAGTPSNTNQGTEVQTDGNTENTDEEGKTNVKPVSDLADLISGKDTGTVGANNGTTVGSNNGSTTDTISGSITYNTGGNTVTTTECAVNIDELKAQGFTSSDILAVINATCPQ